MLNSRGTTSRVGKEPPDARLRYALDESGNRRTAVACTEAGGKALLTLAPNTEPFGTKCKCGEPDRLAGSFNLDLPGRGDGQGEGEDGSFRFPAGEVNLALQVALAE